MTIQITTASAVTDADLDTVRGGVSAGQIVSEVGSGAYSGYKLLGKFGWPGKVAGVVGGGLVGLGTSLLG
ncbi:MAG: hypothetical protein B7Y84_15895 [Azorhizobium sp. 32-67-21]|nr:MAG: hypothetical protein B7Z30_16010 [Rhizobiales bacterium 12-68-15]OYX85137.1 MAG: hypothetical protein B7Y84_15895 [Azorhizobium sp. 32-67-21]OYY10191.1 MAG: hypothetical protein B7Y70_08885 [Rhizobiales bacterium 35-68-8]